MQNAIIIALSLLNIATVVGAWRLIDKLRRPVVEKVQAEPVEDFPELYPHFRAELQRRKAPTYRQTQANAAAYVIEAM